MIRRYGRARPGQRVVDHVPDNYGSNYTRLAAMGLKGLHAPWVVDGAVNGDIFLWWVRHILCPTLQPGDIVLWDNRCVMHYRTEIDVAHRRVMHRTTIKGEPIRAPW